jgi:hypothetical protein
VDRNQNNGATKRRQELPEPRDRGSAGERRRMARVQHDDRGNAYVEWQDAPAELVKRPVLEIEDPLQLEDEAKAGAYDPYANRSGVLRKTGNTTRTDLRKLSDWIKMMRELEERKRSSPDEED